MSTENFPFSITELTDYEKECSAKLSNVKFVKVGSKKWLIPWTITKYGSMLYNFEARESDIYILGHLRVGSTAVQELIWLLANGLDYETARNKPAVSRVPSLEHILHFNKYTQPEKQEENDRFFKTFQELQDTPENSTRLIKTHLPFELLPKNLMKSKAKVIYVIREPLGVLVSTYEIYFKFSDKSQPIIPFHEFWEYFKKNLTLWAPYFDHVKEAWDRKDLENVHLIFFDDFMYKKRETIQKMAKFLGKQISGPELDGLEEYLSQKFVKENSGRTKEVVKKYATPEDKWKEYVKGELEVDFKDWLENNLKGTDIKFKSD